MIGGNPLLEPQVREHPFRPILMTSHCESLPLAVRVNHNQKELRANFFSSLLERFPDDRNRLVKE